MMHNLDKVAATKAIVERYVTRNSGKKVGLVFDTLEQAREVYEWFHATPRNGCTATVTYFERGKLRTYDPTEVGS